MNKKSYLRMLMYLIVGGIVGFLISTFTFEFIIDE